MNGRKIGAAVLLVLFFAAGVPVFAADTNASAQQIVYKGDSVQSQDGMASISKYIYGTEWENIFDIELEAQVRTDIRELVKLPPVAVALVMDVSYTMTETIPASGQQMRYEAMLDAAADFIRVFRQNSQQAQTVRQLCCVGFNTDAMQLFGLQSCKTEAQAAAMEASMRSEVTAVMQAEGYSSSASRFTNIEAGLKMAGELLEASAATQKFIVLLTDGRPTTYLVQPAEAGSYTGWDPIMQPGNAGYDNGSIGQPGYFYNRKKALLCYAGTSYSDLAAARTAQRAAGLRAAGTEIYCIGVGLNAQQPIEELPAYVVDCYPEGEAYVVGNSVESYKAWLRSSVAGGVYYDAEDAEGISEAYSGIFAALTEQAVSAGAADWVATDPLADASAPAVEFLGFFSRGGDYLPGSGSLTGSAVQNGENSAVYEAEKAAIRWDLKQSGFSVKEEDGGAVFTYSLRYRVRLDNWQPSFSADTPVCTNGTAKFAYRLVENGVYGPQQTLLFERPQVKGYLGSFSFRKLASNAQPLPGARFTLRHAPFCESCSGVGNMAAIADAEAVADERGEVLFSNIPSGHSYLLCEQPPEGYQTDGTVYTVRVAYGRTQVHAADAQGNAAEWTGQIVNTRPAGTLSVSKQVSGSGDKAQRFSFSLRLRAPDGSAYRDAVLWQLYEAGALLQSGSSFPDEAGALRFALRHEQQMIFFPIWSGTEYLLQETVQGGYTVSVNGEAGNAAEGGISEALTAQFVFENYRPRPNADTGV